MDDKNLKDNLDNNQINENKNVYVKHVKPSDTIYDERKARAERKEKNNELKKKLKDLGLNYFSIVKKIFSKDKEANQYIKEIFSNTDKKHYSFFWVLALLLVLIPFINLIKSGVQKMMGKEMTFTQNSSFFFPCFAYLMTLICYFVIVMLIIFIMEWIFSKRHLKVKDLINLLNIKIIIMIFYTALIVIVTLFKPIGNVPMFTISSGLMLISLSTSDALMIRIGRKTGIIRETSNLYMILLNTLLSISMFVVYFIFLMYL